MKTFNTSDKTSEIPLLFLCALARALTLQHNTTQHQYKGTHRRH